MALSDLMVSFLRSRFIILLSIPRSSILRLSFRVSNQYILGISQFFSACYNPRPFHPPLSDNFGKSKNCEVPHYKILPTILVFLSSPTVQPFSISISYLRIFSQDTKFRNHRKQQSMPPNKRHTLHVCVTLRLTHPTSKYNDK
jgi:hypothetical protein